MSAEQQVITDAALAAAQKPLKVSGDAGSAEQHNLKDLIALDQHLANKRAARRGIRQQRVVPPAGRDL